MRRTLWQWISIVRCPASLRGLALVLWFSLSFLTSQAIGAVNFTATLDRDAVNVGESAVLTLSFEGGQPKAFPALPNIPNLRIAGGGSSRNISIINGQMTSSIQQTYEVTPTQPGEYTIPALSAQVEGKVLSSQPLKLKAVKAGTETGENAGDQLAFFKLYTQKKEIYLGEVLSVELQVYVRDGVANAEQILQWFDQYAGPALKAEGFTILKTAHAQRRQARLGNRSYRVATVVTSLSPVKTGQLTLNSMDANLPLQIPSANGRRRDPFDPLGFFGQQLEQRQVALSAEPLVITALPLPKENVPAGFNGAVGEYTFTATASPTNVAMGDPITIKIQVSGHGAFDALPSPQEKSWPDFKTYPATSKIETTDPLGLEGSKTFEQVVVPQSTEIKELPAISFCYFSPEQKSYRTLTQPPIRVVVRPTGANAPLPIPAGATRNAQETPTPAQDIVHIKARLGTVGQIAPPLLRQPWFLALQSLPFLAWLAAWMIRLRREKLANNPKLRRQRKVAQIVRDGLVQLRQLAAQNKADEFFAQLVRLLQEQLGERLDLPASAITEAVIEERLRPRGVAESTLNALRELFQTCNLVRYAPIKTSQELAAIIPKLETVLRELQQLGT